MRLPYTSLICYIRQRHETHFFMKNFIQLSLFALVALAFTGCSTPSKSIVNDPNGNFHLYVSNQSFAISPVDIKVFIDGKPVVNGSFNVGTHHTIITYVLKLSPGQHKIVAESLKGHAKLERTFEVHDKLWADLAYWYYPKPEGGAEPCPRQFTLDLRKEPIYFM